MTNHSIQPGKIVLSVGAAAIPAAEIQIAVDRHVAGDSGVFRSNHGRHFFRTQNSGYYSMYHLACGHTVCIHTDPTQTITTIFLPDERR